MIFTVKFEFKCSPILCSDSVVIILYLRLQNSHCLRGTKVRIIQTLAFNCVFKCSLLSSPALSRVASSNHTRCVLLLEVRVEKGGGGGGGGRV